MGGGAPYPYVRDQFGRHLGVGLDYPTRRFTLRVEADVGRELSNQL
jgi:hypothetical protein